MESRRFFLIILTCLVLTGLMLRAYNVSSQGYWSSDGLLYYELARGIFFDGKVLSNNAVVTVLGLNNLEFFDHLFFQGKFGHILLIVTAFLIGSIRVEMVLYLNVALGTATLYLTYLLGSQVFNREVGLISLAISTFSLLLINYSRSALTPAGSMFFFTLGLYVFLKHLKSTHIKKKDAFIHPYFLAGFLIGFAFTIHYNLAFYFLVVYFYHLFLSLNAKDQKRRSLKENLILAAGLSLPLMIFEFGYPLFYYIIYKKHILFSYFQEVLFNALEAGGGSSLWNYFPLFIWSGENPAYCILVLTAGIFLFIVLLRQWEPSRGLLLLTAFFPPFLLSTLDFPLVGRNLAPSLPLFAIIIGKLVSEIAQRTTIRFSRWVAVGLVLSTIGTSLHQLKHLYKIQSPYLQAKSSINGKGVLLLANEDFYRSAILYNISDDISVVPSIDSILKDPKSRNYVLLTRPSEKKISLNCNPLKSYNRYNPSWFPPIRHEDGIAEEPLNSEMNDLFVLYSLADCLDPIESRSPFPVKKSVTEIGKNYAAEKPGMTSLTRIQFRTGLNYLNNGHNDEAIYELKQVLKTNPKLFQGHNNLAFALIKKGRYEEALQSITKAQSLVPGMYQTQNLFGLVHFHKGEFEQAIQYFEKAITINPKTPIPYQYLVNIYTAAKKDIYKIQQYVQKLQRLTTN